MADKNENIIYPLLFRWWRYCTVQCVLFFFSILFASHADNVENLHLIIWKTKSYYICILWKSRRQQPKYKKKRKLSIVIPPNGDFFFVNSVHKSPDQSPNHRARKNRWLFLVMEKMNVYLKSNWAHMDGWLVDRSVDCLFFTIEGNKMIEKD